MLVTFLAMVSGGIFAAHVLDALRMSRRAADLRTSDRSAKSQKKCELNCHVGDVPVGQQMLRVLRDRGPRSTLVGARIRPTASRAKASDCRFEVSSARSALIVRFNPEAEV